jgi:hypothetical protein
LCNFDIINSKKKKKKNLQQHHNQVKCLEALEKNINPYSISKGLRFNIHIDVLIAN